VFGEWTHWTLSPEKTCVNWGGIAVGQGKKHLTRISNFDCANVRGFAPRPVTPPTASPVSHLFLDQRPRDAWLPEVFFTNSARCERRFQCRGAIREIRE